MEKLDKEQMKKFEELYNEISPTLESVIKTQLIYDKRYVEMVDKTLARYSHSIKDLSIEDLRMELNYFCSNTARAFILKLLTLDYIKQLFLENTDYALDSFWEQALKEIIDKK